VVAASDGTLVSGARGGDKAAFAELYDRKARLIRAVCYDTTHDLDAAAELTQETFLRAYKKLESLRDPQCFAPWLVGIARQVCREWRRARRRDRSRQDLPDSLAAPPDPAPDERLTLLREALGALPARERLSLHAFYLQDLDAEQARTVLGLSRSGLYRLLSCARERLRRLLMAQEVRP
jgi:RNA polymerase sigma-70 factor (ECF subfamily)